MNKAYILIVLLITFFCNAQNETAYVKQTQFGYDLDSLIAHSENPIFTKFSMTQKGIEVYRGNTYSLIPFDKINKINTEKGSYRLEMNIDEMNVSIFFTPYPYKNSEPVMFMSIVTIAGLNSNNPKLITLFKLVFFEEMKI